MVPVDIVEIMGDAAGELADRFHLLGLPDPFLRRDLVGEVAEKSVEQKAAAGLQRGDAEFRREFPAVASPHHDLAAAPENQALPGAQEAPERGLELAMVVSGHDQVDQVLAEHVLARPSEDGLRLRIPVAYGAALVHLHERIERGLDDVARELRAFAQRLLRKPAFGHVAADEEMPLDRLRPGSHPGQRHRPPILVKVAQIDIVQTLAAPRHAHRGSRNFQIVRMDEVERVPADHLFRQVAENGLDARADLDQSPLGVRNDDQVLRRFEDAAPFLDLLAQRLLGLAAFREVAGCSGGADDLP
jgi:hypothetical protein